MWVQAKKYIDRMRERKGKHDVRNECVCFNIIGSLVPWKEKRKKISEEDEEGPSMVEKHKILSPLSLAMGRYGFSLFLCTYETKKVHSILKMFDIPPRFFSFFLSRDSEWAEASASLSLFSLFSFFDLSFSFLSVIPMVTFS